MLNVLPDMLARTRGSIGAKITAPLMGMVVLFVVLGAVGLQALRAADQRTQSLIDLQRQVSAYQSLQSNTTALSAIIANAFMRNERRELDTAMREIGQIAYDFGRAEFLAGTDSRKLEMIKDDYAELVSIGKQVLRTIRTGNVDMARRIHSREVRALTDRIERLSFSLISSAEAEMLEKAADGERQYDQSQWALVAIALGQHSVRAGDWPDAGAFDGRAGSEGQHKAGPDRFR